MSGKDADDPNVYFVAEIRWVDLPADLVPGWVTADSVIKVRVVNDGYDEPVREYVAHRHVSAIAHYPTDADTVALMDKVPMASTVTLRPRWHQVDRAVYEQTVREGS